MLSRRRMLFQLISVIVRELRLLFLCKCVLVSQSDFPSRKRLLLIFHTIDGAGLWYFVFDCFLAEYCVLEPVWMHRLFYGDELLSEVDIFLALILWTAAVRYAGFS